MFRKWLNKKRTLNFKSSILFSIISVSFPIFISSVTSIFLGVSDTIMIGHTDVKQLAAVSGGTSIFAVCTTLIVASLTSSKVLTTKYFGAQKYEEVSKTIIHTFVLGIIIALFTTFILIIFSTLFLDLILKDKNVSNYTFLYLTFRLPELFLIVPLLLLRDILNAQLKTKWSLYSSTLIGVSNIVYGLPLIFGFWIIPPLGVIGAGISSSLATLTGLILMAIVYIKSNSQTILKHVRFEFKNFTTMFKLSFPSMISALTDYLANLLTFIFLGIIGTQYLAAGRIAFNVDMLLFTLVGALGGGGRILIGRSFGRGDYTKIIKINKINMQLLITFASCIGIILILFPKNILSIFTNIPSIYDISIISVQIIGFIAPLIALDKANTGLLRALGKTKLDMYSNLIPILFVQVPTTLLLIFIFKQALTGVYISFSLYWISRSIITSYYTFKVIKKFSIKENEYNEQEDILSR